MRKAIFSVLALLLIVFLVACDMGNPTNGNAQVPGISHTSTTAPKETTDTNDTVPSVPNETVPAVTAPGNDGITGDGSEGGENSDTKPDDSNSGDSQVCAHANAKLRDQKESTCTEAGYTGDTYCVDCNYILSYGEATAVKGHGQLETVGYVARTCTTEGYTGDLVCVDCNQTIVNGTPTSPRGHGQTAVYNNMPATCTEDGYTGDLTCCFCLEVLSSGSLIPATGHAEPVLVGYVEPTTSSEGYSGDYICTTCGYIFECGVVLPKLEDDTPKYTTRWIHEDGRVYEFTYIVGESPFDYTLEQANKTATHTLPVIENEILRLMNEERVRLGLPELRLEEGAYYFAKQRCLESFEEPSVQRPDGRRWMSVYYDEGVYLEYAKEILTVTTYLRELYGDDISIANHIYWGMHNEQVQCDDLLSAETVSVTISVENIGIEWRVVAHFFGYTE